MSAMGRGMRILVAFMIAVVMVLLVVGGYLYYQYSRQHPHTDDAYVHAHIVHVAAQVSGPIVRLPVQQYQAVSAHQLLFEIDSAPYALAVKRAHEAWQETLQSNAVKQQQWQQAKLSVKQRQSEWHVAQQNAARMHRLAAQGLVAQAQVDAADNQLTVAQAAYASAQHQQQLAHSQWGGEGDQDPVVRQAKTALATAQLNLSHTKIYAPATGQVATLPVRVGSMVQPGQPVLALVETGKWWVVANFKETQLEQIKVGQPASVTIDLMPGVRLPGVVTAISRGSGRSFSLLPAENATGNWVKVTQRFSVYIALTDTRVAVDHLRDGGSASVTIDAQANRGRNHRAALGLHPLRPAAVQKPAVRKAE